MDDLSQEMSGTAFLKADGSGIVVFMHMPVGLRKYKKTANGMVEICKAIHGNLYGKAVSANACVHIDSTWM